MRRTALLLLPTLAASLTLAACGSSGSYSAGAASEKSTASSSSAAKTTAASSGSGAVVKTAANSTLGTTVLTDAAGMTLYRLSGERAGKFICTTAPCTQLWHPLAASTTSTPSGVASLATVKRPDGTEQVTYKGMPLYTFAQDQRPGDAKGEGFKDVGTWNAVTAAGASSTATPPASSSTAPPASQTTPAESGGGYHY
jgi:predicted lipoprotein with Yx(FWY)xxD motif